MDRSVRQAVTGSKQELPWLAENLVPDWTLIFSEGGKTGRQRANVITNQLDYCKKIQKFKRGGGEVMRGIKMQSDTFTTSLVFSTPFSVKKADKMQATKVFMFL